MKHRNKTDEEAGIIYFKAGFPQTAMQCFFVFFFNFLIPVTLNSTSFSLSVFTYLH